MLNVANYRQPDTRDLSMRQIYEFNSCKGSDEAMKYLQEIFQLDGTEKNAILVDFYYYALSFARDHKLSPEQSCAFFSLMKRTHEHCIATSYITLEKDYDWFKDQLLKLSVHRPPFSQKVFSFQEMKDINDYALSTYFRHYLMYKYAFTKKIKLDFAVRNADFTPKSTSVENLSKVATAPAPASAAVSSAEASVLLSQSQSQSQAQNVPGEIFSRPGTGSSSQGNSEVPLTTEQVGDKQTPVQQPAVIVSVTSSEQPQPSLQSSANDGYAVPAMSEPEPEPIVKEAGQSGEEADETTRRREQAITDLQSLIANTLASKMEELKVTFSGKLAQHEETLNQKLAKLPDKKKK